MGHFSLLFVIRSIGCVNRVLVGLLDLSKSVLTHRYISMNEDTLQGAGPYQRGYMVYSNYAQIVTMPRSITYRECISL